MNGTLEMERHLDAPIARVFEHLTQTDFLLQWWGPEGTTITDHRLDFSRLGPWSAHMVSPQGHGATVGGDVRIVDPPHIVELSLSFAMPDGPGPTSIIRFTLHADGDATRLVLTQSGLDPAHIADMRDKGWNSALGRLATLLHDQ